MNIDTRSEYEILIDSIKQQTGVPAAYIEIVIRELWKRGWRKSVYSDLVAPLPFEKQK